MNQIEVITFGRDIKNSITNGEYKIIIPVTYSSSGDVLECPNVNQFIEFLKTDYIDSLEGTPEDGKWDYYNDTFGFEVQAETELIFDIEYPYTYSV